MKKIVAFALTLVLGCAALAFGAGCESESAVFANNCNSCHDLSYTDRLAYTTYAEWSTLIDRMQNYSSSITEEEASEIASYLASVYAEE